MVDTASSIRANPRLLIGISKEVCHEAGDNRAELEWQ